MTEKPGFDYKFETLDVAIENHIAVVSLDNPPVNAFSRQMTLDIAMCCDTMSEDDAVRVIVLTGKGKHFCAGADLKNRAAVTAHPSGPRQLSRLNRECFHSLRECKKPVIAAINGAALGAGLAIVASCDILLASEKATLGLPEIDVGLMGGGRHSQRLFSHSRLRRMALTGYRVPGPELYRLGVVEACVPPDELMPAAMQMAADIAAKSPQAAQLFKTTLNAIEHMTIRDGYRHEQDQTIAIGKTEDSKEAQRAFLEKRKPVFTGR